MKCLFCFILGSVLTCAQPLHVGVRAGLPLNDYFQSGSVQRFGSNAYASDGNRYTVGPFLEIRVLPRLSVGVDVLYRRLEYDQTLALIGATTNSSTVANCWDIPITARYRLVRSGFASPYIRAGFAIQKLTGVRQDSVVHMVTYPPATTTRSTNLPAELKGTSTAGVVVGSGLEFKAAVLRFTPEVRYTRWKSELFQDAAGLLNSDRNQVEFLVGITW